MIENYEGKVAVITGAASGIGKAIAKHCCGKGMRVVISDIEKDALEETEAELNAEQKAAVSVVTDVSKLADIEELARRTVDTYGSVHLLCNNAGIGATQSVLQSTIKDYQWVFAVNLWGVIYGMKTFLPIMLKQDEGCHIVNTSSGAGLTPGGAAYGVAKCGVSALSEMYAMELGYMKAMVGVSALIPGIVNTNIVASHRNRPDEMKSPGTPVITKEAVQKLVASNQTYSGPGAMLPETVADIMFHGIEKNALYIFTDLADEIGVQSRTEKLLSDVDILRQFIKGSGKSEEEFFHKGMGQGLKNRYRY